MIVLFAIVLLIALAGYIIRPSSKTVSNALYIVSAVCLVLLALGFARVV